MIFFFKFGEPCAQNVKGQPLVKNAGLMRVAVIFYFTINVSDHSILTRSYIQSIKASYKQLRNRYIKIKIKSRDKGTILLSFLIFTLFSVKAPGIFKQPINVNIFGLKNVLNDQGILRRKTLKVLSSEYQLLRGKSYKKMYLRTG